MHSIAGKLAHAVAVELNEADFAFLFAVTSGFAPIYTLKELQELRVTVIPRSVEREIASRAAVSRRLFVDVAVQRAVSPGPQRDVEVDELLAFTESLADYLNMRVLQDQPQFRWLGSSHDPMLDIERLYEQHCFASLLTLTYRYDHSIEA